MPRPILRPCALLLALSGAASAALPDLTPPGPARLLAQPIRVTLERSPAHGTSAAVYAFARGGERASDLAAAYGVDPGTLRVDAAAPLAPGAVLRLQVAAGVPEHPLPPGVRRYRVRAGDTLASVAGRFGLSPLELLSANTAAPRLAQLTPGQTLLLPGPTRGLLLRLQPGQSAADLIRADRADPVRTYRANGMNPARPARVGDYLLLPGVWAAGRMRAVLAQRAHAVEDAAQHRSENQYRRYVAFVREKQRQAQRVAAARQAAYDRYQATLHSPARKALQAAYDRQVQYETFLARQAEARQARIAAAARQTAASATPPIQGSPTLRRAAFGRAGIIWPMQSYRITSRFGERDIEFHQQHFHGGVDLAAPLGTPIHAATDGVVEQAGYGDFGLNVWMREGTATVIYGHMSRVAVAAGQAVRQGEVVGYVGCTGYCTGPHLHFEVRLAGQAVDPLGLLP